MVQAALILNRTSPVCWYFVKKMANCIGGSKGANPSIAPIMVLGSDHGGSWRSAGSFAGFACDYIKKYNIGVYAAIN